MGVAENERGDVGPEANPPAPCWRTRPDGGPRTCAGSLRPGWMTGEPWAEEADVGAGEG